MGEYYSSGTVPLATDTLRVLEEKILRATGGGGGGGGGGGTAFNNLTGNGTPVGVKTPDYIGQFYTDFNTPGSIWVANGLTNADWREYLGNV